MRIKLVVITSTARSKRIFIHILYTSRMRRIWRTLPNSPVPFCESNIFNWSVLAITERAFDRWNESNPINIRHIETLLEYSVHKGLPEDRGGNIVKGLNREGRGKTDSCPTFDACPLSTSDEKLAKNVSFYRELYHWPYQSPLSCVCAHTFEFGLFACTLELTYLLTLS